MTIRAASAKNLFDLREQPGVRIGVVISDDDDNGLLAGF